jgi:phospholipid transport system substrate-binding protein
LGDDPDLVSALPPQRPDPGLGGNARSARTGVDDVAPGRTEIFDFTEITRGALGRHWRRRPRRSARSSCGSSRPLLERADAGRVERFDGERIAIAGASIDGEWATVRTRLLSRVGGGVVVDSRSHPVGERRLAYDVSVEGVSLAASSRT